MTNFRRIFHRPRPRGQREREEALQEVRSILAALKEQAAEAVEEGRAADAIELMGAYQKAIDEARKEWPGEEFLKRGD